MFGLHLCIGYQVSHPLRMNSIYYDMSLSAVPTYSITGSIVVSINILLIHQQGYYRFRPIWVVRLCITVAPLEALAHSYISLGYVTMNMVILSQS